MKKKMIALCDSDRHYLERLQENLEQKDSFPFAVDTYTSADALEKNIADHEYELILAAGEAFEKLKRKGTDSLVLLKEKGISDADVCSIRKFQSADGIRKDILELCAEGDGSDVVFDNDGLKTKLIGVYSPVGRDIQTSFSLLTGQFLAKKKRVLYLNLEPFSGLSEMLDNRVDRDITDLIYYLVSGKEKLRYKLESMVNNIGGLDYVSPAFSFLDLGQVSAENWLLLINTLRECGNYDYLIIDLSEIIQGVFDILKECDVVYTIAQKEGLGPAKLDQYEKLLKIEDLDSVIERTSRCELPLFNDLPSGFDELPYSKLASYVKQIVSEDL